MSYSKGICWVDDTRIPFVDEGDIPTATTQRDSEEMNHKTKELLGYEKWGVNMDLDIKRVPYQQNQQGRFTPSLLVCDDMLNDGSITLSQGGNSTNIGGFITAYADESKRGVKSGFGDKGTNSRYYDLDKWFDKVIDNL